MQRRRTRWWSLPLVVAGLTVAGLVVTGCGGDDGDGDDAERIASELVAETGGALDQEQASCVAERLVSSFGDDSFREVLDAAEGSGDDADDVRIEVIDIFAACDALGAVMLDDEPDDEPDEEPAE